MIKVVITSTLVFSCLLDAPPSSVLPYVISCANNKMVVMRSTGEKQRELVDINRATLADLEGLPGIGRGLARRIIEHRERYGRFRRIEHLMIVRGISERRFRELRPFVKAE